MSNKNRLSLHLDNLFNESCWKSGWYRGREKNCSEKWDTYHVSLFSRWWRKTRKMKHIKVRTLTTYRSSEWWMLLLLLLSFQNLSISDIKNWIVFNQLHLKESTVSTLNHLKFQLLFFGYFLMQTFLFSIDSKYNKVAFHVDE